MILGLKGREFFSVEIETYHPFKTLLPKLLLALLLFVKEQKRGSLNAVAHLVWFVAQLFDCPFSYTVGAAST